MPDTMPPSWQRHDGEDPLDAARGCVNALLISLAVLTAIAIVIAWRNR